MGSQRINGSETLAGEILAANEVLAHYDSIAGLYMRVGELVYGVALKYTQNPDVAEDIRQQAFIRARNHYDKDTWTPEHERTWMARVTINLTNDYWRHQYSFPEVSLDAYYLTIPDAEDPFDFSEQIEASELANHYLGNVSAANREATWLYYGEGMGPQDIGNEMGSSKSVAATRASRGMQQIRKVISNEADAA